MPQADVCRFSPNSESNVLGRWVCLLLQPYSSSLLSFKSQLCVVGSNKFEYEFHVVVKVLVNAIVWHYVKQFSDGYHQMDWR